MTSLESQLKTLSASTSSVSSSSSLGSLSTSSSKGSLSSGLSFTDIYGQAGMLFDGYTITIASDFSEGRNLKCLISNGNLPVVFRCELAGSFYRHGGSPQTC